MSDEHLDIPDFLRRQGNEPKTEWKKPNKKPRARKPKRHPFHLPRNIEPAGLVLLKQIEREKEEKKKVRLAMLRELKKR